MGRIHRLERSQRIERPLAEVFAFFADASKLETITPHFLRFRTVTRAAIEMRIFDFRRGATEHALGRAPAPLASMPAVGAG